jgi:hypothetical protein
MKIRGLGIQFACKLYIGREIIGQGGKDENGADRQEAHASRQLHHPVSMLKNGRY